MKGRKTQLVNVPGTYRVKEHRSEICGDGMIELLAEKVTPDALCIMPKKKNRMLRKLVSILGTAGIVGGVAIALILSAPGFGIFFFALLAWVMFGAWAMGE